jgi:hypothetical protein
MVLAHRELRTIANQSNADRHLVQYHHRVTIVYVMTFSSSGFSGT